MRILSALTLAALVAAPAAAQQTRFTREMAAGDKLELANINGAVTVRAASGRTAEIVVTKVVKSGDGSLVKAILEEERGVVRVCTIYLTKDPNRSTCEGDNSVPYIRDGKDSTVSYGGRSYKGPYRPNTFQVDMTYEVRLPEGVQLEAATVNGNVTVNGATAESEVSTVNGNILFNGASASELNTVNGNILFDGASASELNTVNGTITANLFKALRGDLEINAVNGNIQLAIPGTADADLSGDTVHGKIESAIPVTIEGKWGPKSFTGRLGRGGPDIEMTTVNGNIVIKKL
jgi:hypothetical protein